MTRNQPSRAASSQSRRLLTKFLTVTLHGFIAAGASASLIAFAAKHPLGFMPGTLIVGLIVALMCIRRDAWLLWIPGLAPVADLAAWTGHIYFTESDALVLGALLVGSVRELFPVSQVRRSESWMLGPFQLVLVLVLALSYGLSTQWSAVIASVNDPTLWAGYNTSLNGPRVAKGFVWALLLLPYLSSALRQRQESAQAELIRGIVLGSVMVSLTCLWERVAFTGISDLTTDYRTTGLFWEMNVGGATLDGWLALTTPFALWLAMLEIRSGAHSKRFLWLTPVLLLLAYAIFTTFSRGLYAGIALAVAMLVIHMIRGSKAIIPRMRLAILFAYALALTWMVSNAFQAGGYRGMIAMLGLAAAIYASGPVIATVSRDTALISAVIAVVATALSLLSMWIPKGIYIVYGVNVALLGGVLIGRLPGQLQRYGVCVAFSLLLWLAANAALVCVYWGEGKGVLSAIFCVLWLSLPAVACQINIRFAWSPSRAGCAILGIALGGVAILVAMFSTYYASSRLGQTSEDLVRRMQHWSYSASLPQTDAQIALGVGTGRFVEHYFWQAPEGLFPGNHHLRANESDIYLSLDAPRHILGFGELYRVSQRILPSVTPPMTVSLRARSPDGDTNLHVEVCRRHLLYVGGCTGKQVRIPAGSEWRNYMQALESHKLGEEDFFPPKFTVFSIANDSRWPIEVDDISLVDARGLELIDNGNFSSGSDFWFFSSDRYHLPWHAKNLWLHYYVEQGLLGFAAFAVLGAVALLQLNMGLAKKHPLAAPLSAALIGFFAVGVFDSLVDSPRLATIGLLMIFIALGVRRPLHPQNKKLSSSSIV